MDDNLARLERIYPNSKYVLISPYDTERWKGKKYDSAFDNKAAMNRWNTKPLDCEQAQAALSRGNRIGWVVPKGFVIVDIDNKDDLRAQDYIERLLKKFEVKYSYNYTSKGIHILLQDSTKAIKSDSRTKCGLNLVIDTRANDTGYIILPSNDPHRAWGEWNDFVEDIPYFLKPALKDATPSFIGMTEGDGRNNALFKWRTQLEKCNKFKASEIEKCIRIINENIFDTAIPNQELFKTVLREKETKKQKKEEQTNPYNDMAIQIVNKYDIVSYYDNFYKFNGIYYKPLDNIALERIIHFEISENISKAGRKEIIEFLKVKSQISIENFNKDWYKIACKNGIINLVTGDLEVPTKSDINTIFIPHTYSKDCEYSPRIDEFMKQLCDGDPLKMTFLYQIAGYCLLKRNLFETFVICRGKGSTGKSTYMNIVKRMLGDNNCSTIRLQDFDKDYQLATTVGKLANIDDDVDDRPLEYTGRFKAIISGNEVSCRQIYREVISFIPFLTCIFSCNKLPRIMDKTSGLFRRMILLELNNPIKTIDPLYLTKITESDMEYFLLKSVEAIGIAIEEGHFRITQSESKLMELFRRRQSPINEWLYENSMTMAEIYNVNCNNLYKQFIAWCEIYGYSRPSSLFTFKEDICSLYDVQLSLKKIDNVSVQVFYKYGEVDMNYKPFKEGE